MELSTLTAISPLDGRYYAKVGELRPLVSEYGLIYHRLIIEIRWLVWLTNYANLPEVEPLDPVDQQFLENLIISFDLSAAEQIKTIEQTTRHDVKAIEYYLQHQISHHPKLSKLIPFIHFGCTSEDINNLAYSLILETTRTTLLLPAAEAVITKLQLMAQQYASHSMLARTHGQPASPTTVGKELINTVERLKRQFKAWKTVPILAKFNGAVGNFNAHHFAYPDIDWPRLSQNFIQSLGLSPNTYTTQIEPHDNLAEQLHILIRFNTILIDLNRNLWGYISLGYFRQKPRTHEVGSSTMPHKVNPIDFENSEGNLGIANALANHLATKLPISRWQRDLTDSTVLRNIGVIVGHSLLAYQSALQGLNQLIINETVLQSDLDQHWEVLGEAVQTVLRRYGVMDAYERLKGLTRGHALTAQTLADFIDQQPIPDKEKQRLKHLTPKEYIGYAIALTQQSFQD